MMNNKPLNRDSLKSLFSDGSRPNANNFASLIDSMVNKVDDGLSKDDNEGIILSPEGEESDRVVSFYDSVQDELPKWSIEMFHEEDMGLGIVEPTSETENQTRLFFEKGGNIGIDTRHPKTNFEVNGILGTSSRVGTYKLATIPADGSWRDIVTNLNGCVAFEVMAQVGKEKAGRYALLHSFALSTFGKSRNKIKTTQAHYGWWWNKMSLRWAGSTYDYSLQLRTRSNYGQGQQIKYCVTKLWDNDVMSLFDQL